MPVLLTKSSETLRQKAQKYRVRWEDMPTKGNE